MCVRGGGVWVICLCGLRIKYDYINSCEHIKLDLKCGGKTVLLIIIIW